MVIPRKEVTKVPYLKVLTSERWGKGHARYYCLFPAREWNGDLTLLSDLLQFLREEEGHFRLPQDWKRLFSMLRLADFLGTDRFLAVVSTYLLSF